MKIHFLLALMLCINCALVAQHNVDSVDIFHTKQQEYLALTQYYQWFQTFEREQNDRRIKNHLNLLSDSIVMNTYAGPVKGKEGMKGFLDYVKPWQNSHHIENVKILKNNDATLSLEADILRWSSKSGHKTKLNLCSHGKEKQQQTASSEV